MCSDLYLWKRVKKGWIFGVKPNRRMEQVQLEVYNFCKNIFNISLMSLFLVCLPQNYDLKPHRLRHRRIVRKA